MNFYRWNIFLPKEMIFSNNYIWSVVNSCYDENSYVFVISRVSANLLMLVSQEKCSGLNEMKYFILLCFLYNSILDLSLQIVWWQYTPIRLCSLLLYKLHLVKFRDDRFCQFIISIAYNSRVCRSWQAQLRPSFMNMYIKPNPTIVDRTTLRIYSS